MKYNIYIKTIIVLIAALAVLQLAGCRPSTVLEKIRYTANASVTDTDEEQIDIDDDGRLRDYLNNIKEKEALNQLADELRIGPEDELSASDAASLQTIYNTAKKDGADTDNSKEKDPNAVYKDFGAEDVSDIQKAVAADTGTYKLIADASGGEVELPRNVSKAAACNLAAQIVEMVAGSGRLAACDSDLLANEIFSLVVEDAGEIESWWEGDGRTEPISDTDFAKLLADPEIDVCFEISGQMSFTEEQIAQLYENGKSYVALYPVDTLEDLENDVRIVGQVMTNGSGDKHDSVSRAESYISWAESQISQAGRDTKNFSRYTAYIAGWDDFASYKLTLSDNNPFPDSKDVDSDFGLEGGAGSGLAYAYTQTASELFTELAEAAGVTNTSTLSTVRISHADNMDYVYVAPVFESFRAGGGQSITGKLSYYSGNINAGYSPFLYRKLGSTSVVALGTGDYPAVIVSDDGVKEHIMADPFWNYAGYCGPLYTGSFYVCVNPRGFGDWTIGSVESPLEAKWVAKTVCNVYTEDELLGEITDFYASFFMEGNPSQEKEAELQSIIRAMLEDQVLMEKR